MDDWKKKIIEKDGGAIPEWKRKIIEKDSGTNVFENAGPDPRDISGDAGDAPWNVRMAVGALDKPEDRLKAIQKTYPDAKPYGEDNFIFTDPDTGTTRLYNRESWFPSLGDFASIAPEIGETIGGAVGGTLGGIGGGVAGSAVPVIGTGVGAFGGAVAGAGGGSVAGREGVQRGLNWLFGNEDTRTGSEQAVDAAKTFALGAAGEGAGRAVGAGWNAGKNTYKKMLVGEVDDVAKAQARLADLNAIGADNPLPGMVNGNSRTSKFEHALSSLRNGDVIQKRIDDAHQAMDGEFDRIVSGTGTARTQAELGELLKEQAKAAKQAGYQRSNQLYDRVGEKVTSPAVIDNTSSFLQKLTADREAMGSFDKRAIGSQTDSVIDDATAILEDAQNGMTFDQLQKARTIIGQRAKDTDDKVLSNHLNGLYGALTADMEKTALASGEDAAQAWRKANNQYRRHMDPEKGFGKGGVADKIIQAPDTDKIWQFATETTNKGGNRIAQIRRTVEKSEGGKDAWADVVSSSIEQLGKSTDVEGVEQFNSTMFLNKWSKMSPEAKDAIFKGTKNQQYRQDLDRLARVSNNMKQYARGANHSNSQTHKQMLDNINPLDKNNVLTSALGMAAGVEPMSALAIGAAKGAAKAGANKLFTSSRMALFKNPETVAWLADIPKAEMQKGGMQGHMKKLVEIRKRTSDQAVATAIADYFRDLGYEDDQ
ncbi:hypothetical protein G6L16_021455 [Agrobacterium tumefaciens]|uniref:hypothetical protein n=1 Tax=Agrobacterium tumefaciens TaxID=358 RepID=UPI00157260DE|nr:hypothetical protein [Agrobacterium tumefaciens]NSZ64610.1 hypothetical protein [Agrobacterium tumefaciens]WIE40767.1 hypothetical protein G6L16_021455 [Agrobacterium tumefaciens]